MSLSSISLEIDDILFFALAIIFLFNGQLCSDFSSLTTPEMLFFGVIFLLLLSGNKHCN